MPDDPSPSLAPGAPGAEPFWSRAAKDGVGTAYHTGCQVWFTLAQGIVTEVYYPTVDTPNTRDLRFLITDGETFVHDEKDDLRHHTELPEPGALFYRITNTAPEGRYRLIKEVLTDPHTSVLLLRVRLEIPDESLRGKLRLFALLAPHLGGQGTDNNAGFLDVGERTLLHAEREDTHIVLGCDRGFAKRSVGYVGASDGWQDLNKGNFQMDWQYRQAGPGTVALTGEVRLGGSDDPEMDDTPVNGGDGAEFTLGVAFGDGAVGAAAKLLQSFVAPFARHRENYLAQWQRAEGNPDEGKTFLAHTGDGGTILRLSHRVLLAHEDKTFQGALVASVSTPWGESKTDKDAGGYHLVWTRDLVQSASALLAVGEVVVPLRALLWLTCIQKPDGSFPQNSWIDGTPYWEGIQLDEMAAPMLLAWRLWKFAPEAFEGARFRPVLLRALSYLLAAGPVTAQDRWEENAGYSPSTIAVIIAAFCAGADIARDFEDEKRADFALVYADWLNAHVEEWCATGQGGIFPGKEHHYIRITPAEPEQPDPHPDPDTLEIEIKNGGGTYPARNIVSGDFLHLVRLGIRPATDALVRDSLEVYDDALQRDLPAGAGWRRYPCDGYGQKANGEPFDDTGEGRCWPILTGERGHYEIAAGRDATAFVKTMEGFANETGLLPEQTWDAADIPEHHQIFGRPSGSAMPLCWSHAEYISLVRSVRDRQVFDRIEPAFQRYAVEGKRDCSHEIWTFRQRTRRVPAGRTLRLLVKAAASVRWTMDGWTNTGQTDTTASGFGTLHFFDVPNSGLEKRAEVEWTFFWKDAARWEGENFQARII